jgi:asparagine synthase (glutamine-hydrolysing)
MPGPRREGGTRVCGIAGIFRPAGPADDLQVLRGMLDALAKRGPDGEGIQRERGLTLGHRRLAILDLSPAANQPMTSPGGRFVISFNGEIYNYRELARELAIPPGTLRTSSDTEVLLAAWERWGADCLDRLVGQWAFAMYDREENVLWLARDRFGEKPLFYHRGPGVVAFASTLAGLIRVPWVAREIDREALAEYLTLRYVVSPRTLLRDVRKVPPGCLLRVHGDAQDLRRWWSPRFRTAAARRLASSAAEASEQFGSRLVEAARRCTVADVPVAVLLSDGIDSHGVLAALRQAGLDCPTYTYFVNMGSVLADEERSQPAADGADRSRLIRVSYEAIAREIEPALGALSEPVGDGAVLALYHLIRRARPEATVFLAGHGGDELLGGYRLSQDRFRLSLIRRFSGLPLPQVERVVATFTYGDGSLSDRRRRLARSSSARAPEAAHYLIQRPLPPEELHALFAPLAPPGPYLGVIERLYGECAEGATDLDRVQEVAIRSFLSEHTLTVADSSAMASSAESRLPYLDRDVADYVFGLPPQLRVSPWPGHANTKLMLRRWAKGRLPEEVLKRKKRTFRCGSVGALLGVRGEEMRSRILDCGPLRRQLGGLEAWLDRPPAIYRRGLEGTYWALLAFAIWSHQAGMS